MDNIVKSLIIEILKNFFEFFEDDVLEEEAKGRYEKFKLQKKIDAIIEHLEMTLEAEGDSYIREICQQYYMNRLYEKIYGIKEIDIDRVEDEFKEKYKITLRNDSKKRLVYGLKILDELISDFLSTGEQILLSSQKQIDAHVLALDDKVSKIASDINAMRENNIKNDYDRFVKKWNSALFMEKSDERKLSDVFVETNFRRIKIYRKQVSEQSESNLKITNDKYVIQYPEKYSGNNNAAYVLKHYELEREMYKSLNSEIREFMDSDKKISIIIGLPGSGKSSLISYLAGKYYSAGREMIFVTLSKIKEANSVLEAICIYLGVELDYLEGKTLVLDGFDEIGYINDANSAMINFINKIKNSYNDIKVYVTVRENCIDISDTGGMPYYALCYIMQIVHFDMIQMIDFHNKYTGEQISLERLELLNGEKEVFGIPLLLYLVYSLEIDISSEHDKYKLYQKIFSRQNGIYDKCNEGNGGYDSVGEKFTVEDKESFHIIAQIIAYKMYVNNTLTVSQTDVEKIIFGGKFTEKSKICYLYNNFYEKSDDKIAFIHKSFYEYFLAEYMGNMFNKFYRKRDSIKEKCRAVCKRFSYGIIEEEVYKHLLSKLKCETYIFEDNFSKFFSECVKWAIDYGCRDNLKNSKGILDRQAVLMFNLLKFACAVQKVTGKGMCLEYNIKRKNIKRELINIEQQDYLEPHLLDGILFEESEQFCSDWIEFKGKNDIIADIKNKVILGADLSSVNFTNSNWSGVFLAESKIKNCRFEWMDLRESDYRQCDIVDTQFTNANLVNTNFRSTRFKGVNFRGSNLQGVDFSNCNLENVKFDTENIDSIEKYDVDKSEVSVYIIEKRKFVSYGEYLSRKEALQVGKI